ncbi:MAG: pyrroline-5-carboxylate reductase [Oscillospiraceae bacterium]|jgi:pyrroline-5-carboxylate reductase
MENTFVFIGAGNMGGALVEAVCRAVEPKNVAIYDRDAAKLAALAEKTGCTAATDELKAVEAAHYVFLCVKPKIEKLAIAEIAPALKGEKVIVSIAAGTPIESVKEMLAENGVELPVVRLMPNTPVAVGKGLILMARDETVSDADVQALCAALAPGGMVEPVSESLIDAATPVFSCSPAYVYMFIEALADGGVMNGVPREQAQRFAAQAVLGSAEMVLKTGKHPGELKDAVCSPGGSTIVGVETLERGGFRGSVASAVYNAYVKTVQLGK